jgi:hypothetical protein
VLFLIEQPLPLVSQWVAIDAEVVAVAPDTQTLARDADGLSLSATPSWNRPLKLPLIAPCLPFPNLSMHGMTATHH